MAKFSEELRKAGIKIIPTRVNAIFSPIWYKSGEEHYNMPQATQRQIGWIRSNEALNPISAPVWSYISAPGMGYFDVQQTLQSFERFQQNLGTDPFLMFDLETTSTNVESELFHPTEIAMAKYANFRQRLGTLNIAVAPNPSKAAKYRSLIAKARSGQALTKEERYAIASMARYAPEAGAAAIDKATNQVMRHNRIFARELEKVAQGNMHFTSAQLDAMEMGLNTLIEAGLPEHKVHTYIKNFFSQQGLIGQKFTVVGHNIEAFDLPGMSKLIGKEKWAELLDIANGRVDVIDTLNLFRAMHSNPTMLYKRAIRDQILGEMGGVTLNYRVRRQINKEVARRMRALDFENAGLLTMDSLRKLAGITGPAHIAVEDIQHQADVFAILYNPVREMIESGRIAPSQRRPGIRRRLQFSTELMQPGQFFMAMEGFKGTGYDIAMDDKGAGAYNWVLNRRAIYEFEGMYQDNDIFMAKFYSQDLGRRAILTGSSIDEVRRKIQAGALQYIDPNNINNLPQEQLEDLARRRLNRWMSLDSSGYEGMKRAVRVLNGDIEAEKKLSFTEARDLRTLQGRLTAEKDALNMFIEKVEKADLRYHERTLAFKYFYRQLNEEFPTGTKTVNRMWDPTVEVLGHRISLRTENFVSRLRSVLEGEIRPNAVSQEASLEYMFQQALIDLREHGYINQDQLNYIQGLNLPVHNKGAILRDILLAPGSKVVSENIAVEVESVTRRLTQIDMQRAAEIAEGAIEKAKRQARAFQGTQYLTEFFQNLAPEYRERVIQSMEKIVDAYGARGLGVHFAQVNNRLMAYIHAGDRSTMENVVNTILNNDIPRNAVALEMPILSNAGNIIIGEERRLNQKILTRGFKEQDIYGQIISRLTYKDRVDKVAQLLASSERIVPDYERAEKVLRGAIHDVIEEASGISRATTRDVFEESNWLDIRGNDADIIRRNQVNVQRLAEEFFEDRGEKGKQWKNLSLDEQAEFLRGFRGWALDKYGSDAKLRSMIERMTGEGVKEEKFRKGFFSLLSERDFTPFGLMSKATRPNLIQWLNYYAYTNQEITEKLQNLHYRRGIGINPFLVTQTEHAAYRELSAGVDAARSLVKGVSIGAIQLSSSELVSILESERGRSILAKYGLTAADVMGTGTWEQGVIGSPELRGLLEARQPKIFEVSAEAIEKGQARFSRQIQDWLDTGAKSPLQIKGGSLLFEEYIPTIQGKDTISTFFDDLQGNITSIELDKARGVYRINAEAVYPMEDATKVMFDTRKGTLSYFGRADKSEASSRAMHELLGEDIHLIYLGNRKKHQDFSADIKGQITLLAERAQSNGKALERLRYELEKSFGYAQMVQLPGHKDYTIEIADASEMASRGYTPEYFEHELNRIINIFQKEGYISDADLYADIGGFKARRSIVELRRVNVNEVFRFSDYLGRGVESGAGLKIGPRELRSLRAKGMIIGANMEPLINYLTEEAEIAPGMAAKNQVATEMVQSIEYLINPERMAQELELKQTLQSLPSIKGRDWYSESELAGTILDPNSKMFALELPTPIETRVSPGIRGARTLTAIPVGMQMVGKDSYGRIFLDKQARTLANIYTDIESYRSFSTTDAPHGEYSSIDEAYEALTRHVNEYIEDLARNVSSSEGIMMEKLIKTRMPASGRLKAQGISADLRLAEHISGTVYISQELAEKMFQGAPQEIMERLMSKEGFYGILMRDPNEAAWNFQIMNYKVDRNLKGRVARMSAVEAAMMGADFDGDQVGMLSPFSKRMQDLLSEDPNAFNQLQMELSKIHAKQTQYNARVANYIKNTWLKDKADQTPEKLREAFQGAFASQEDIVGKSYLDQLMTAHLSKMAAGPLYNVSQRYGDVGLAIFQAIPDEVERAKRIELLNMFTEITTERFALKGKTKTPLDLGQIQEFKKDLYAGENLAAKWSEHFANAMSDYTALYWSGAKEIIKGREIDDAVLSEIKHALAPQILRNIENIRTIADRVAPDYFKYHNKAAAMFFSDQATAAAIDLVGMTDQYLRIRPDQESYMRSFIPTDVNELFAKRTGQYAQYMEARSKFYDKLKIPNLTKLNLIADAVEDAAHVAETTGIGPKAASGIGRAVEAASDISGAAKAIPSWFKVGAFGIAGLAIVGSVFRKEPKPELVPEDKGYGPEARIEMNKGEERQANGQRITVRAKNDKNVALSDIAEGIKLHVSEGNVNIYQKDDTRSLSHEWVQEMFTNAIKYGNASTGTPNTY